VIRTGASHPGAAPVCHGEHVAGIAALVFDVGGVLEVVSDADDLLTGWRRRLGLRADEFTDRLASVDPEGLIEIGGMSEAEFSRRYAEALGLDEAQAEAFMRDMWDWYCGDLDTDLVAFVRGLRPRYRTAILSNSADGARREEERRYQFGELVDLLVYSHEVGLAKPDPRVFTLTCDRLGVPPDETIFLDDSVRSVDAARGLGMHALLHEDTPASIAAITALLDD